MVCLPRIWWALILEVVFALRRTTNGNSRQRSQREHSTVFKDCCHCPVHEPPAKSDAVPFPFPKGSLIQFSELYVHDVVRARVHHIGSVLPYSLTHRRSLSIPCTRHSRGFSVLAQAISSQATVGESFKLIHGRRPFSPCTPVASFGSNTQGQHSGMYHHASEWPQSHSTAQRVLNL